MEKIDAMGIYSINIPLNLEWHRYKYALYANGETFYKADPYATYAELRPETTQSFMILMVINGAMKSI